MHKEKKRLENFYFKSLIITQGPVVQNLTKLKANVTLKFLSWNMVDLHKKCVTQLGFELATLESSAQSDKS